MARRSNSAVLVGIAAALVGTMLHAGCSYDYTIGDGAPTGGADGGAPTKDASSGTDGAVSPQDAATRDAADAATTGPKVIECNNNDTCTCNQDENCRLTCKNNGCNMRCEDGATCQIDCPGGNCDIRCEPDSKCTVNCLAGNCQSDCRNDATCNVTCGTGCTTNCQGGPCTNMCAIPQACQCRGQGCK